MTRALSILVLAVLLALPLADVQAGEPTTQIRTDIDRLYRVVQRSGPSRSGEREGAEILDRMFDWTRMAAAALGKHWQERTPAQRTEFATLFAQLFRGAYLSRIHLVDASKFQYLGDVASGDRATVRTKVFTKRGSAIDVDYLVRLGDGGRWRIEDVRVERVSLMDNYRTQFDAFIRRSSYDALVTKLRDMTTK